MRRVRILISGNVIGVSFRYFIKEKALELGLTGYVRNSEDKKVEAIFEGNPEKINKIIHHCRQGPKGSKVTDVKIIEEQPKSSFKSFNIIK